MILPVLSLTGLLVSCPNPNQSSVVNGSPQDSNSVPALPPDSTPAWILSDSSIGPDGYTMCVIDVWFKPTATQADRQAAIDVIGGAVVGGVPDETGDGYYIVLIADDGTGAQLEAAIARLALLPTVEFAARENRGTGPSAWPRLTTNYPSLDPTRTTVLPGGTAVYFRTDATVAFEATTTDVQKAAILSGVGATVLGVTPGGVFFIHFPDPGPAGQALRAFLENLRSTPGVHGAVPILFSEAAHSP